MYLIKKNLYLIPLLILAFIFIGHGYRALIPQETFVVMVQQFNIFKDSWVPHLVRIVGILDISAILLTIIKPYRVVLLYLALWPLVPASMGYLTGRNSLIEELLHGLIPLVLIIIYYKLYKLKQ